MLQGIDPLLSGETLRHLDAMGHSDAVVVADAHFPARRLAARLVDLPGIASPRVLSALGTVLPLDDIPALDLMASPDRGQLAVQDELLEAAGVTADAARFLERQEFYDAARDAYLIVRTGETRSYGNALLRKGIVTSAGGS
ncbi:MAG: RbsD/FucU family protein [Nocardioidaceae bacterium]